MKCPTCPETVLVMSDRSGIEIDYCPTCRGVWLDRGELDRIIERSSTAATAPAAQVSRIAPADADTRGGSAHESEHHEPRHQQRKKKSSFLGELFDF